MPEEVGVDRGLGDLKITCVLSPCSANWSEINEWYLDDLGVGFMEGSEFDSGTAFHEGNPTQNSQIFSGASRSKGVAPSHKPSSFFLNFSRLAICLAWRGSQHYMIHILELV